MTVSHSPGISQCQVVFSVHSSPNSVANLAPDPADPQAPPAWLPCTLSSQDMLRYRFHQSHPPPVPPEHIVASTQMVLAGAGLELRMHSSKANVTAFTANFFLSLAFTSRGKVPICYCLPVKMLTGVHTEVVN